jgi:hypothetical protein
LFDGFVDVVVDFVRGKGISEVLGDSGLEFDGELAWIDVVGGVYVGGR